MSRIGESFGETLKTVGRFGDIMLTNLIFGDKILQTIVAF